MYCAVGYAAKATVQYSWDDELKQVLRISRRSVSLAHSSTCILVWISRNIEADEVLYLSTPTQRRKGFFSTGFEKNAYG